MAVKYTIVIPTYEERDNLPLIVSLIYKYMSDYQGEYEILIVDDNSPDGTAQVAVKLQSTYPECNIQLLKRPAKLGLGSAYIDAMQQAKGTFVILMDADLSHHPKFIPDMIKKQRIRDYDLVSGTRYSHGGGVHGWDFKRIFISRCANYLAHILLNPRASDLTGSFRLYKKDVLQKIMHLTKSRNYNFQMEVISRATRMNLQIAQVPITFVDRIYGKSKLGAMEVFTYLKGLLQLFWEL